MIATLSCPVADRQAVRYFFFDLAQAERAAVNRHLAQCPRCRRKFALFERIWRDGSHLRPKSGVA
jgi:hypothetical protein